MPAKRQFWAAILKNHYRARFIYRARRIFSANLWKRLKDGFESLTKLKFNCFIKILYISIMQKVRMYGLFLGIYGLFSDFVLWKTMYLSFYRLEVSAVLRRRCPLAMMKLWRNVHTLKDVTAMIDFHYHILIKLTLWWPEGLPLTSKIVWR